MRIEHPDTRKKRRAIQDAKDGLDLYNAVISCREGKITRNDLVVRFIPLADRVAKRKCWPWRSRDEVHELALFYLTGVIDWLLRVELVPAAVVPKVFKSLTVKIWNAMGEGLVRIPLSSRCKLKAKKKLEALNLAVESVGVVQDSSVSIPIESFSREILEKLTVNTESDYDFYEIVEKSSETHSEYHAFLHWSLGLTFTEIGANLECSRSYASVMVHRVIERLKAYYD